jgi:RecJ-like exonuclease
MTSGSRTYFHCHPEGEDPGVLLDPDNQLSEPWGEPEHGACDKCGASGTTAYECFSCMEAGPDPGCPACQGRVRFEQTCPTCEGSGEIHRTQRHGVAVFPDRVVSVERLDPEVVASIRDRVGEEGEGEG